jgi:hypothetical protein
MAWAQQLPAGSLRNQMFNNVLQIMALKEPAAAYEVYLKLDATDRRNGNVSADQIFQAWAVKDPAAALAKAGAITSQQQRSSAYSDIVGVWADTDPQAALEWANSLTNATDKKNLANTVLSTWAGNKRSHRRACVCQRSARWRAQKSGLE